MRLQVSPAASSTTSFCVVAGRRPNIDGRRTTPPLRATWKSFSSSSAWCVTAFPGPEVQRKLWWNRFTPSRRSPPSSTMLTGTRRHLSSSACKTVLTGPADIHSTLNHGHAHLGKCLADFYDPHIGMRAHRARCADSGARSQCNYPSSSRIIGRLPYLTPFVRTAYD